MSCAYSTDTTTAGTGSAGIEIEGSAEGERLTKSAVTRRTDKALNALRTARTKARGAVFYR